MGEVGVQELILNGLQEAEKAGMVPGSTEMDEIKEEEDEDDMFFEDDQNFHEVITSMREHGSEREEGLSDIWFFLGWLSQLRFYKIGGPFVYKDNN